MPRNDWEGTAELKGTVDLTEAAGPDLASLLGIDHDLYWILGFNLWRSESTSPDGRPFCYVKADVVERVKINGFDELQPFAREHEGVIPVIRMERQVQSFESVIGLFKYFEMEVTASAAVKGPGHTLSVTEAFVWNEDSGQYEKGVL
jgi:hypothetical protein